MVGVVEFVPAQRDVATYRRRRRIIFVIDVVLVAALYGVATCYVAGWWP